jgi:hypothetical protein
MSEVGFDQETGGNRILEMWWAPAPLSTVSTPLANLELCDFGGFLLIPRADRQRISGLQSDEKV